MKLSIIFVMLAWMGVNPVHNIVGKVEYVSDGDTISVVDDTRSGSSESTLQKAIRRLGLLQRRHSAGRFSTSQ
jgi:endonuclease YncB( thermonuclease family)